MQEGPAQAAEMENYAMLWDRKITIASAQRSIGLERSVLSIQVLARHGLHKEDWRNERDCECKQP